jgi:ribosomal protein S19
MVKCGVTWAPLALGEEELGSALGEQAGLTERYRSHTEKNSRSYSGSESQNCM